MGSSGSKTVEKGYSRGCQMANNLYAVLQYHMREISDFWLEKIALGTK